MTHNPRKINRPSFLDFSRPLVIAHRGGAGLRPENTVEAFENAINIGVDMIELDVRRTADNKIVVIHDKTLDRTTNGSGVVCEMTASQVAELDAGYNWTNDGGETFPYRAKGLSVPNLTDVLATYPEFRFNIEIKDSDAAIAPLVCDLIREHEMEDRVLLASQHTSVIRQCRRILPEVLTSAGEREVVFFYFTRLICLSAVRHDGYHALQVPMWRYGIRVVTRSFVDAAHKCGLHVHVWTVNPRDKMRYLIEAGVDGIVTDYPKELSQLLD